MSSSSSINPAEWTKWFWLVQGNIKGWTNVNATNCGSCNDPVEEIVCVHQQNVVCDDPNHMACDCLAQHKTKRRLSEAPQKTSPAPSAGSKDIYCGIFLEKGNLGSGVYSASLVPWQNEFGAARNSLHVQEKVLHWWILGVLRLLSAETCSGHGKGSILKWWFLVETCASVMSGS